MLRGRGIRELSPWHAMNAAVPDELSLELRTGREGGVAPETGLHACDIARTPAWTLPLTDGPETSPPPGLCSM